MTHQSPKTLKGGSEQTGKTSNSATKELDFSPKEEPMIKMSQKKPTNPPPLFKDTDMSMTSKVLLPTWLDLYKKIHHDDFPEFTPHSDPEVRELDDQMFQNIKRSSLYMVASRTHVLPCVETLEWIIHHTNAENFLINNRDGECINVFLPTEVSAYYKLKDVEVRLNKDFVVEFYECHNTSQLLASWWREDKKFMNRASGWYNTVNLREPYMFLMALICSVIWGKGLLQVL
jgi:hypothetical protein